MPEPIPFNRNARAARRSTRPPASNQPVQPAAAQPGRNNRTPERQTRIARERIDGDKRAFATALGLTLTVLVPWLIGRFLIRDSFFLPRSEAVFDIKARDYGSYFVIDLLAGCCLIAALLVVFLLLRPWEGRALSISAGLGVTVVLTVWGLPTVHSWWTEQEKLSVARLNEGTYPFMDLQGSGSCRSVEFHTADNGGWIVGIEDSADSCDQLEVYHGWRKVGTVSLKSNTRIIRSFSYTGLDGAASAYAAVVYVDGPDVYHLVGFSLALSEEPWSVMVPEATPNPANDPEVIGSVIAIHLDSPADDGFLLGIDMRTGGVAWEIGCPRGYQLIGTTNAEDIFRLRCLDAGTDESSFFAVGSDGSLTLVE